MPRSEKNISGENRFFSRSGKSQGISKFYLKVSGKSEKFTFGWPLGLGRRFLVSEGVFGSKNPAKELISVASLLVLLPKDLPWMVSENWSLVSEKSGKCQETFSFLMSGNPVMGQEYKYNQLSVEPGF